MQDEIKRVPYRRRRRPALIGTKEDAAAKLVQSTPQEFKFQKFQESRFQEFIGVLPLILVPMIVLILATFGGCLIEHHYKSRLDGTLQKIEDAPARAK